MHRVIYDAYDKGYAQGRKDYERAHCNWLAVTVTQNKYVSYRCTNCKSLAIAKYEYCPHCGAKAGDDNE